MASQAISKTSEKFESHKRGACKLCHSFFYLIKNFKGANVQ